MKFVSPVPMLDGLTRDSGWLTVDLTPYAPATATFAVFEIEASLVGINEGSGALTEPSVLLCRANGDPHRLRQYTLLKASPAKPSNQIMISSQALGPIGEGMRIDFRLKGPEFSGGVTCNLIAYLEECPESSVEESS